MYNKVKSDFTLFHQRIMFGSVLNRLSLDKRLSLDFSSSHSLPAPPPPQSVSLYYTLTVHSLCRQSEAISGFQGDDILPVIDRLCKC